MKKLTTLILMLLILFSGCAEAKIKQQVKTKKELPQDQRVFYLNIDWWDEFDNPQLHDFLIRVFTNNSDLKIANLKIKQGEQIVKQSFANELPQIGLSGNVERTLRASDEYFGPNLLIPNYSQTNLLFPISANYELDIWGANHTKTKSVKKQLEIVKEQERAQFIAITGNFASTYYNLVKCDKLIKIQKELIELQNTLVELTQIKFESGKCPVTELITQQKILKNFDEELNILTKERAILEEDLRTVMVDTEHQKIDDTSEYSFPSIAFPSQINSEIIESRPDCVMAMKNLERMGLDVKVAKKNLLPRFIIFGQLGFNAYHLDSLFSNNALLSSIGVAPVLDIFSGGRKIAYLRYKKYEYEEALTYYKKTALVCYKEVNDALVIAKINKKNLESAVEKSELENKNYEIAKTKFETGYGTKLEMLEAKEAQLAVEKDKINWQANSLIAVIGLYKSVGGKNLGEIKESI